MKVGILLQELGPGDQWFGNWVSPSCGVTTIHEGFRLQHLNPLLLQPQGGTSQVSWVQGEWNPCFTRTGWRTKSFLGWEDSTWVDPRGRHGVWCLAWSHRFSLQISGDISVLSCTWAERDPQESNHAWILFEWAVSLFMNLCPALSKICRTGMGSILTIHRSYLQMG